MANDKRKKLSASLSLDLDNLWSYMKVHGDENWENYPTYLPRAVPIVLEFLARHDQKITFFIVGADAAREGNRGALRLIADAGHEVGNHSFNHEPWMQSYDEAEVADELTRAAEAIESATGLRPTGFRGPGFSNSPAMLAALRSMGYEFDASILPSVLGPLARLYYFWGAKLNRGEKETRGDLFGHVSDGFRPLKPFDWQTPHGRIMEIPVSTIPIFRVPFHLSYLLWLSRFSEAVALAYMKFAFAMCRLRRVEPSFLLHPLDFLGADDAPELAFFPGMDMPRERKLAFAGKFLTAFQRNFDVVPMGEHHRRIRERGSLKVLEPPPVKTTAAAGTTP